LNIEIKLNQFKPSLNDSWLAGFTDALLRWGVFFVSVSSNRVIQRFSMAQKDAELEFSYLSQLIQGNLEKYKSYDRVVVNYLKLDTIIEYFSRHKLYSIKAKSLEK